MKFNIEVDRINIYDEQWYVVDNTDCTSVTTILDVAPKGKAYETYLRTVKNPDEIRNEAAQLGSDVHKLIEDTLKHREVFFREITNKDPVTTWQRYIAWCFWFKDFITKNNVEWVDTDVETIVYDKELAVAGTIDWVPVVNGHRLVIDWKTGRSIWDTAHIQVATYHNMYSSLFEEPMAPHALIVQINETLNKKGYREHKIDNLETNYEFFLMYHKIWHRTYPNRKPLYRSLPTSMNLNYLLSHNIQGVVNGK